MNHNADTTGAAVLLIVQELMRTLEEKGALNFDEVSAILNVHAGSLEGPKGDLQRIISNNGGS